MTRQRLTTDECLRDLMGRASLAGDLMSLAEFCEVTPPTALGWLTGETEAAGGITTLKLRCYLDLIGYEVAELEDLAGPSAELARVVAFDVMSVDEIKERLEYTNTQAVYRVILHGGGLNSDRAYRVRKIVDEADANLDAARSVWRERVSVLDENLALDQSLSDVVTTTDTHDEIHVPWLPSLSPDEMCSLAVALESVAALAALVEDGGDVSDVARQLMSPELSKSLIEWLG